MAYNKPAIIEVRACGKGVSIHFYKCARCGTGFDTEEDAEEHVEACPKPQWISPSMMKEAGGKK